MGIMGTLVHYSRIMARSNNAAIRALSIILYSQRNNDIHYPERIMDDKKQCIIHDSLSIIHAKRLSRTPHSDTPHNASRSNAQRKPVPCAIACINQRPLKSRSRSGLHAFISPFAFSILLCCDPYLRP